MVCKYKDRFLGDVGFAFFFFFWTTGGGYPRPGGLHKNPSFPPQTRSILVENKSYFRQRVRLKGHLTGAGIGP